MGKLNREGKFNGGLAWLKGVFVQTRELPDGSSKSVLKKGWRIACIVLVCVLALGAAAGTAGSLYIRHLRQDPASLFTPTPTPEPTPAPAPVTATAEPTPEPTLSPYEQLQASADTDFMKNTVNILLIGVDYAEERETWSGKHAYHSDVMIVAAVNFEKNTVDLISLPRDTYAQIPGVNGKYKLNASIDCGGGRPTESGFEKVCEAAEWMLGGIPVDYYYAVSMQVVKDLVDIIGGVEFDVEMDFTMQGREYKKGLQFMDGQAVLDYCRVRKNIPKAGDQYRVDRQKEMLLALFKAAQTRSLITKIPQIVDTFSGDLYTNCSYSQTAALALFGYGLSPDNISMHSMRGTYMNIYNWLFCITDQQARVDVIEEVYGVKVPQYEKYSLFYCQREWGEMTCKQYLAITKDYYKAIYDAFEADIPLMEAAQAAADAAAQAAADAAAQAAADAAAQAAADAAAQAAADAAAQAAAGAAPMSADQNAGGPRLVLLSTGGDTTPPPEGEGTPDPAPQEVPSPTPDAVPTPEVTPDAVPTPEVTPEPTPEIPVVTPEPTPEVTPEPAPEVTPEVTPEPTPEITPEPTPTPVPPAFTPEQHEKYQKLKELHELMTGENGRTKPLGTELLNVCAEYKELFPEVAAYLGISMEKFSWAIPIHYDIQVDFR